VGSRPQDARMARGRSAAFWGWWFSLEGLCYRSAGSQQQVPHGRVGQDTEDSDKLGFTSHYCYTTTQITDCAQDRRALCGPWLDQA